MSKTLRTVALIAGSIALIATGVGAVAGAKGLAIAGATISAKTLATVGTIASLTATAATVGAQVTAKRPSARGSITQLIIEAEPPRPYLIGETYFAGVLRHRVGYGATLKKVVNPFLLQVVVYSSVGPVNALVQQQFDFDPIGSYYTGFYSSATQLGARPESDALVPPFGAAPGWTSASKLSGCAAIAQNYKFDRDGKVFASGIPATGAIWQGEMAYDPRLDSTFPGGSGACRLGVESTYVYTRSPPLHAGTYAYGRFEDGKKIIGIGIPADGIDWATVAAWANDCTALDWYVDGVIFEGGPLSGSEIKARNLDDICAAGGGRWLMAGAVLSFDWHRPRVSLETITDKDIISGEAIALQTFRDRFNTVRPRYTSAAHNYELITADPIVGSTYVTEDGESKVQAWPFNMVTNAPQAGELAAYALVDSREVGPITLLLGEQWRRYKPGDTLRIESAIINLQSDVVILKREIDPATLQVRMTFKTETPAKHDFALGKVAVPPPTPVIGQTASERDEVATAVSIPPGYNTMEIAGSYTVGLASIFAQANVGGSVEVTIPNHERVYTSGRQVSVTGAVITLANSVTRLIYYDSPTLSGGAQSYQTTTVAADAYFSAANPDRHFIGYLTTIDSGGGGGGNGGSGPPGGGGWDGPPGTSIP